MRIRIRYTKRGKIRFTSHRDLARIWERALRKAGLPVAYSQGYSPRPRLSFGLALPTGFTSDGEYLDVVLAADLADPAALAGPLNDALPAGIDTQTVAPLEGGAVSLQEAVDVVAWRLELVGPSEAEAAEAVADLLARSEVMVTRERKGRTITDDLRPAIRHARVVGATDRGAEVEAELATAPRSVRPNELADAINGGWPVGAGHRLYQWIETDGPRREPLPLTQGPGPHAEVRAS